MEKEEFFEAYKSVYWNQFSLAEQTNEIDNAAETFYNAIYTDIVSCAALVTVLNYKCWDWYEKGNEELSSFYSDLYYKYNANTWDWLEVNGTEEEKSWYFHIMD